MLSARPPAWKPIITQCSPQPRMAAYQKEQQERHFRHLWGSVWGRLRFNPAHREGLPAYVRHHPQSKSETEYLFLK